MKNKLIVYEKSTCTTCKKLIQFLSDRGIDFENIDYYIEPLNESKILSLLKKMGIKAQDLLRKKEDLYKELSLGDTSLKEEEIVKLMVQYPDLIQRPIVEFGDKAVLGRPIENVESLLNFYKSMS